jgi:redox-sensitive bicupin YhaK (pirin superfamily)
MILQQRTITKIINAQASSDGDGVKISRSIGSHLLTDIDPFLLLDELRSDDAADYMGGFPSHPHRGFETVTYMLEGQMRHKDSTGNEGLIRAGDIQWMTAGSGIIHSELPEQTQGRLWGFQFWINLPADQKMRDPRYQEIASNQIPEWVTEDGKVRVLAGTITDEHGNIIQGAANDIATQPLLLDVQLNKGDWQTSIPEQHVALVYVYRGELTIAGSLVQEQQLSVLSTGDLLTLATQEKPFGALILAAQAINEPITRAGPFVMNTEAELQQAFSDFRSGSFG